LRFFHSGSFSASSSSSDSSANKGTGWVLKGNARITSQLFTDNFREKQCSGNVDTQITELDIVEGV